jgi:ketosteroid isomerase-like protein
MKWLCAGLCLAMSVTATTADGRKDKPDTKAEIQAIYDDIGRAFEKQDIDGVTKYSLPDATAQDAEGKEVTLKEWKERARKSWADIKQTKSRFKVEEAKADGDAAIATYNEVHEMVIFDPKDGQEHKVNYQAKWRATLKKTTEGWRVSRSVELERGVTRDGVLIDQWPKEKSKPSRNAECQ